MRHVIILGEWSSQNLKFRPSVLEENDNLKKRPLSAANNYANDEGGIDFSSDGLIQLTMGQGQ